MESTYKNPWHDGTQNYGPAFYTTNVTPTEYKGFKIYNVWERRFDLVKSDVCAGQYAGLSGAKNLADILSGRKPKKDNPNRFWFDRSSAYLKTA